MAMTNASANAAFLPQDTGPLIVRPVIAASVAAQLATVVTTSAASFRVPIVSADPSAAWVAEGAEITPSDATLAEAVVAFKKVAGLTVVSNELIADATPEAAQVVGDGLARDIARKIDAAFFANTTTNGPSGLLSVTTATVDKGSSWTNTDPFVEAVYAAAGQGAAVDMFVTNPADGLTLAKIKDQSGSNRPLLGPDPTQPGRAMIAGIPILTSPAVAAGEAWAIPRDRVYLVIRDNVTVETDASAFFTSDRTAIRATMRVGFAFPHPLAVVRLYDAP